jgi:predicted AAA+ superfamily ATPase
MDQIQRALLPQIEQRMKPQKVMMVFGPRRVGKTFLLKQLVQRFEGKSLVLNGEDADSVAMLEPVSIANYKHVLEGVDLLAIDEAQHVPDIGNKLKLIVDEIPGIRVVASGSSSFDLKNQAGEPLVGRGTQFTLLPFSQQELAAIESPIESKRNLESRLLYGSYPEVVASDSYSEKREYLNDIVESYLLKDILAVDGVKNSGKMRDLLRLVAYQMGNELSYEEIGKQLGISKNTVERYLDLLQKVFVLYRLGGYSKNLRKEVAKSSKWYFVDNGIRNAVIRNYEPYQLRSDEDRGALWENYIITERLKRNHNERLGLEYYFWRTYDRQEIDLIELGSGVMNAFEMKSGKKTPSAPKAFANAYPEAQFAAVNINNYMDYI